MISLTIIELFPQRPKTAEKRAEKRWAHRPGNTEMNGVTTSAQK
jgi:hypothetical protein